MSKAALYNIKYTCLPMTVSTTGTIRNATIARVVVKFPQKQLTDSHQHYVPSRILYQYPPIAYNNHMHTLVITQKYWFVATMPLTQIGYNRRNIKLIDISDYISISKGLARTFQCNRSIYIRIVNKLYDIFYLSVILCNIFLCK